MIETVCWASLIPPGPGRGHETGKSKRLKRLEEMHSDGCGILAISGSGILLNLLRRFSQRGVFRANTCTEYRSGRTH
jgi:hypothetical protein